eukprot:TRINITY_DN2937_c0_g5_i1.p1 TRINITY_DN2937_c0_g5~~TRINITY_DN2937_c0_g5_i1.p1  ORF type:complete len:1131 (+),score=403.83 TRINITY_DN2937_c0_g5_i1:393-3395(+)
MPTTLASKLNKKSERMVGVKSKSLTSLLNASSSGEVSSEQAPAGVKAEDSQVSTLKIEESTLSSGGELKADGSVTVKVDPDLLPSRPKKRVRFAETDTFDAFQANLRQEQEKEFKALGGIEIDVETTAENQQRWGGSGEGSYPKKPHVAEMFVRVANDVHDVSAWKVIMDDLNADQIALSLCEDVYKRYFHYFPTSFRVLGNYLHAIENDTRATIEQRNVRKEEVFLDLLSGTNQHVMTYRLYLQHTIANSSGDEIEKAFDSVVRPRVGHDFESLSLWEDYLNYLEKRDQYFQVQQKIRQVYHAMLAIPMLGMDGHSSTWKRYLLWERRIGSQETGYKIPDTIKSNYDRAADHIRTLEPYIDRLRTDALSTPLRVSTSQKPALGDGEGRQSLLSGVTPEYEQVGLWMHLIDFELTDPMHLQHHGDKRSYRERIDTLCKKALVCLSRVPVVWYTLARFLMDEELPDKAHDVFSEAMATNPNSLLIRFAYTDMLRSLQPGKRLKTAIHHERDNIVRTSWQGPDQYVELGEAPKDRWVNLTPFTLGIAVFEDTLSRLDFGDEKHAAELKNLKTVTWLQFMRFLKNAAHSEEEQKLFESEYLPRAHADPATLSGTFYAGVAQLERSLSSRTDRAVDPRALMEKGWQRQRSEGQISAAFIMKYIEVLWGAGDDSGLRMLFAQLFETHKAWQDQNDRNEVFEVFNKYVEVVTWRGQLSQLHTAELLREKTFGKQRVGSYASQLLQRYTYQHLRPCLPTEILATDLIEDAYTRLEFYHQRRASATGSGHVDFTPPPAADDPQQANLDPHQPPARLHGKRAYIPDVAKWNPLATLANHPSKWTLSDDQNADGQHPRGPTLPTGKWRPEKRTTTQVTEVDDTQGLPSLVANLVKVLPHSNTIKMKPKPKSILELVKGAQIPPLEQGRIPERRLAEARELLKPLLDQHNIDPTNISGRIERVQIAKSLEAVNIASRSTASDAMLRDQKKRLDKARLAFAMLLAHESGRRR